MTGITIVNVKSLKKRATKTRILIIDTSASNLVQKVPLFVGWSSMPTLTLSSFIMRERRAKEREIEGFSFFLL